MSEERNYGPTILVVDDFEEIRSGLRLWLELRGYRVIEAEDGQKAIEAAIRECPSLILMDLYMPELDGFSTLRRIREEASLHNVPVVAVSAYGELGIDAQLRTNALATGFDEYVAKPFDPDQLEKLINDLLLKDRS